MFIFGVWRDFRNVSRELAKFPCVLRVLLQAAHIFGGREAPFQQRGISKSVTMPRLKMAKSEPIVSKNEDDPEGVCIDSTADDMFTSIPRYY